MQDLYGMVSALRRPRLLVTAARFGLDDYIRDIHLPRILRMAGSSLPRTGTALIRLLDIEESMDARRRAGAADYSVARHVEVLVAVMAETRLLAVFRPGPVAGPSEPG
ncbi:DUF6477 family protein [Histidinibacterium lentulum]|uniref:Uncharacterized protein n=1 Tax=Histidinibacterium lentulum TaxID=2480588 RepID=A0A3N2R9V1_9RHOB|nr:DUF6477 family protein [Histidinibacterium lentulum]ROU04181.1 hypothetical protein EAT49_01965 [Histidinibacterium lentulum]